mgnify:CR=1 FL=1
MIKAKVESGLEELVVGHLMDDEGNARHIDIIPMQLLEKSNHYDPQKLIDLATKSGQQNKLGYLVDLTLKLAEIHELEGYEDKRKALRYISQELEKKKKDYHEHLYDLMEIFKRRDEREFKDSDELGRKWKIITSLTPDMLDEYMDHYITGRSGGGREFVPPDFDTTKYKLYSKIPPISSRPIVVVKQTAQD